MGLLSDAHHEWHTVHGAPGRSDTVCPLDCYDPPEYPEPEEGEGVRCGHCKGRHWDVADVRACAGVTA